MNICVYGSSSAQLAPEFFEAAEAFGGLIAAAGHSLVFGGGREGLMGAAARGAYSRKGRITGIAPSFFNEPGILFEHCTEMILTETMRERKQLMEDGSDAVIVLPGGIGTFEEFFEMLTLKQLGQSERALVILNTNGYYEHMQALLEHAAENGFMSKNVLGLYSFANTPEEALAAIENYVPRTGNINRLSDYTK